MRNLLGLLSGLLFGAGLYLAGMADPNKVLAFLDVTGAWDPSLALVMVGAIAVSMLGFLLSRSMRQSLIGTDFTLPALTRVDAQLLGGAALFGIGWGMSGYCPGPGFAALSINPGEALAYLLAMATGMLLWDRVIKRT